MGNVVYTFLSPFSIVMGVLFVNVFVLVGLLVRKLKLPVMFSAAPLFIVIFLSLFRMLFFISIPGSIIITSDVFYTAIVNVLRYEILPFQILDIPVNLINIFIYVWIIRASMLIADIVKRVIKGRIKHDKFNPLPRDKFAESLISEIVGWDKGVRVYRSYQEKIPLVTSRYPYILLPAEIDFTPEELNYILKHEWKHFIDRDCLMTVVVDIVCAAFWWVPLLNVLKRNLLYAMELKCDYYAVTNKEEHSHYLRALKKLMIFLKSQKSSSQLQPEVSLLIDATDQVLDRIEMMEIHNRSRCKRILSNVCFSILALVMFVASYTFVIVPIHREIPDVSVSADCFTKEYYYNGPVYIVSEIFVICNGDGTFSLYIGGQHVKNVCETCDSLTHLPIRYRGT